MFTVSDYKQDVVARSRDEAVALQVFARAIPATSRFKVKAGLYPDSYGKECFKVALTVSRTGLLDGGEAIKALRDYVAERRSGTVYRGERELALIGVRTTD